MYTTVYRSPCTLLYEYIGPHIHYCISVSMYTTVYLSPCTLLYIGLQVHYCISVSMYTSVYLSPCTLMYVSMYTTVYLSPCTLLYICLHVHYSSFLSDLKKPEVSRQMFEKFSNIKFHENPSSKSRVVPCNWQTDRHDDLIVAFRNFANPPKNKNSDCCFKFQSVF